MADWSYNLRIFLNIFPSIKKICKHLTFFIKVSLLPTTKCRGKLLWIQKHPFPSTFDCLLRPVNDKIPLKRPVLICFGVKTINLLGRVGQEALPAAQTNAASNVLVPPQTCWWWSERSGNQDQTREINSVLQNTLIPCCL